MENKILEIKNIHKSFKEVKVLKGINFEVSPTEIVSIFGQSGEGKSTLLKIICGLSKQDSGNIILQNKIIDKLEPYERHIGIVMDEPLLFPHMNVFENISFGLKLNKYKHHQSQNDISRLTTQVMKLLGIDGLEKRYPHEISMGQAQRVSIARALIVEPKILLMDEPFSNLDLISKTKVKQLIKKIHESLKVPIILVTHDIEDVISLSDRMLILNQGKIQISGPPSEVLKNPNSIDLAFLLGTENVYEGIVIDNNKEKNSCVIELPGKRNILIESTYQNNINIGTEVFVTIRPEDILILRDNKKSISENKINAKIMSFISTFRMVELLVSLENDLECKILIPPHVFQVMHLTEEKQISVSLKKNSINVIKKH